MVTAITVILVFSILIFIHELGHFSIAKLVGVKVHEFAMGMGPKLLQFTKGETTYSIRALPIGGYVKMEGEDESSNDEGSFSNKPVWARMAVISAGPVLNFVLAIFIYCAIFYSYGTPSTTIHKVIEESPAEIAGIQPGDRILYINGVKINNWEQIVKEINHPSNETVHIIILRNTTRIEKEVVPEREEGTDRLIIGIAPEFQQSIPSSIRYSFMQIRLMLSQMGYVVRGLITKQVPTTDIVGPVGIVTIIGEATKTNWLRVIEITAAFSVNLGFINLLPIPALDGSRIIFLFLELLRGKPIDPEKEGMVHFVGFALLMLLMVAITYQDVLRLLN